MLCTVRKTDAIFCFQYSVEIHLVWCYFRHQVTGLLQQTANCDGHKSIPTADTATHCVKHTHPSPVLIISWMHFSVTINRYF